MKYRYTVIFVSLFASYFLVFTRFASAQSTRENNPQAARVENLKSLVDTPAVSGYEKPLGDQIASRLGAFHPEVDNLGDIVVTLGSGSPAIPPPPGMPASLPCAVLWRVHGKHLDTNS